MSDTIRELRLTLRDRQTIGGVLPSSTLMGEPFIQLYEGRLKFSGVTGGNFEPSTQEGVFEVGSTLYNSRIENRITINDNFIISGDTGLISTYAGVSGAALAGKFLSGTTDGFVLGEISEIQGIQTRVQNGTNIITGGTPDNPTINLVDSPSINGLTSSGTSNFTGIIQSGGTDLYNIFATEDTIDITRVQPGVNINTGGTANEPVINLNDDISLNSINATTLSGGTIYSGSTDIADIFLTSGDLSGTSVSAGSNINVNNIGTNYEVSTVDSPSFNNISFSGTVEGGDILAENISGTTIYSGDTNLENIISNIAGSAEDITRVQPGTNINTGGTENEPIINLDSDISLTSVSATTIYSGSTDVSDLFKDWTLQSDFESHTGDTSNPHSVTASQVGAYTTSETDNLLDTKADLSGATFTGTVDAPTILSGGTDLYDIFSTGTGDITRVQPGVNISTGGTDNEPVVNVIDSPTFAGDITATGFTDTSLVDTRVVYVGTGGRLTNDVGFTYDDTNNLLSVASMTVGTPSTTGDTNVTIYGNVTIVGDAFSAQTSELYIEDNKIELNFNPTASTESTSLGSGWLIQDGSGIAGTDAYFDIRGASVGLDNRSWSTNLEDVRIRETGTLTSPNGVRVIAEFDCIDGGSW